MSAIEKSISNLDNALSQLETAITTKKTTIAEATSLQQDMFASPIQDNAPNVALNQKQVDALAKSLDSTIANIQALLEEELKEEKHG